MRGRQTVIVQNGFYCWCFSKINKTESVKRKGGTEHLIEHKIFGPPAVLSERRGSSVAWSNWSIVRRSLPTSLRVSEDVKRKQKFLLHAGTPAAQQISPLLLSAGAESMRGAPASPLFQEAGGNAAAGDEGGFTKPIHRLRLPAFVNILYHPSTDVFTGIQLKGACRMV